MNQSFNLARFGRLFRKHTIEHGRGYLLGTGVLLGGLALVLGGAAYLEPGTLHPQAQGVLFIMGLLATGTFFTSSVFADFSDKRRATAALLVPASPLEKFLVGWLYALPLFMAVYIGCFYLVDTIAVQLDSLETGGMPKDPARLIRLFSREDKLFFSLLVYAVLNSFFLWGSVFFTKQHFVRTAFGLLVGTILLGVANFRLVQAWLGPNVDAMMPFAGMQVHEGHSVFSVNLSPTQNGWVALLFGLLALLSWAGAYFRIKEKQI